MAKPGLILLMVVLTLAALFALGTGAADISVIQILQTGSGTGQTILFDIRLPRVLLAVLVGAGVASSGAAIQGLFRNPLADPALIGVSGGAALLASAYLVVGNNTGLGHIGLAGSAFTGGLLATWLVLEVGKRSGTISSMLLAGVAINAITLSGVGLFTYMSSDSELRSVAFWALGSLNGADWTAVGLALVVLFASVLMFMRSESLNAMTLGEREAGHLGISVRRLRLEIILLAAVATGVSVALCGVIAFIGLIVPHLIRLTLGSSHHIVLPASALLGAVLLLLADTLARTVIAPAELPVGIITALIGGPFFMYLIVRQKGRLGI